MESEDVDSSGRDIRFRVQDSQEAIVDKAAMHIQRQALTIQFRFLKSSIAIASRNPWGSKLRYSSRVS